MHHFDLYVIDGVMAQRLSMHWQLLELCAVTAEVQALHQEQPPIK
jgi:hypothetical protein